VPSKQFNFADFINGMLSILFLLFGMLLFMMAIGRIPDWIETIIDGRDLLKSIGSRPFPSYFLAILMMFFLFLIQLVTIQINKLRFIKLHLTAIKLSFGVIAAYLGIFMYDFLYMQGKVDIYLFSRSKFIGICLLLFFALSNFVLYKKIKIQVDFELTFSQRNTLNALVWINLAIYLIIFQWVVISALV
jgi:hypothetical protein